MNRRKSKERARAKPVVEVKREEGADRNVYMPPTTRRRRKRYSEKPSGRFRMDRVRQGGIPTDPFEWSPTQRPAWRVRNERRAANRVARKARKVNSGH